MTKTVPSEPEPIVRFMPKPEVLGITGFSATTLWREIQAERFPSPIQVSPNRVGWLESQVREWQQARIKAAQRPMPDEAKRPAPSQRQRKQATQRDPAMEAMGEALLRQAAAAGLHKPKSEAA